jgi:hypothetical protein
MKNIKVYPKHDDYGSHAKIMESVINWVYEQNKSIIEEPLRIELLEMMCYPRADE